MDMITNSMMSMLQTAPERQSTQSTDKSGSDSDFKSLLDQKKSGFEDSKAPAESKQTQEKPAAPAKTQEDDSTEVNSDLAAQLQSAWLNMPVQTVVTEEIQPVVAETVELVTDVTETVSADVSLMQGDGTEGLVEAAEQVVETADADLAPVLENPVQEETAAPEVNLTEDAAPEVTEAVTDDAPEVNAEVVVTEAAQEETTEEVDTFQPIFEDVEAAPIKVAEAPAADETADAQSVQDQVAHGLTEALANGETKVLLSLTPETLGKITVEITRAESGLIHVSLLAESVRTSQLLERNMPSLQSMLAKNDDSAKVEVEIQKQDAGNQANAQYDGNNGSSAQEERAREEQQRRYEREQHSQSSADFLQQMRLGLIPVDAD